MRQRRSSGFTLIELLVVVAILGILVAIAVVNYRNAIERARQRRSMADMRSLVDGRRGLRRRTSDRYPPASGFTLPAGLDLPTGNLEDDGPLPAADLHPGGAPDGRLELVVRVRDDAGEDRLRAALAQDREGMPETAPLYGPTTDLTADIILVNGQFVQWPEGVQQ